MRRKVTAMAKTASLKKTSRAGSRSAPNPRPDPPGEVAANERNQRIIAAPHLAGATSWRTWRGPQLVSARAARPGERDRSQPQVDHGAPAEGPVVDRCSPPARTSGQPLGTRTAAV